MTKATVAFGPVAPGWGSWDWVGADTIQALGGAFDARPFSAWEVPGCDAVVVVKHAPPPGWAERVVRRSALLYAPVDHYGGADEIGGDAPWLRLCARVIVHCRRLAPYFAPYATVEYMDHHVKFAAPVRESFRAGGDLLWAGVRSNLPPLVDWVNAHGLPGPLAVLTNLEDPSRAPTAAGLGFRPGAPVTVHHWSPQRHLEMTAAARAALDVKGGDFRSRHKPPAKGIDFIASGVPLAVQPGSSTAEHLAGMGFDAADPHDPGRWLSLEYWEETRRFGLALRELLSAERVARRFRRVINGALGRAE